MSASSPGHHSTHPAAESTHRCRCRVQLPINQRPPLLPIRHLSRRALDPGQWGSVRDRTPSFRSSFPSQTRRNWSYPLSPRPSFEPFDGGSIIGRGIVLENLRPACSAHTFGADHVLDGHRNPGQPTQRLPLGYDGVHAVGLGIGAVRAERQEGVQLRVTLLDLSVEFLGQFTRRGLLGKQRLVHTCDSPSGSATHRSITFGTRKKGLAASGASANTASATLQGATTSSRSSGSAGAAAIAPSRPALLRGAWCGASAMGSISAIGSTFETSSSCSFPM